jgi:hypothetical protein
MTSSTRTRSSASSRFSVRSRRDWPGGFLRVVSFLVVAGLVGLLPPGRLAKADPTEPPTDPWELAQRAAKKLAEVRDSTCIFLKADRVGKDVLPTQTIELKVRQQPFSVYMRWLDAPHKGREVVYQKGRFEDKVVARLGDLFGFNSIFTFSPAAPELMQENRHSILEAGVGHVSERLRDQFSTAREQGTLRARYLGTEQYLGRPTWKIMRALEDGGYRYWNVDAELLLPIRIATYDARHQFLEAYSFKDLELNVGLTDADFDPRALW